jgi:micrococcal nuclease
LIAGLLIGTIFFGSSGKPVVESVSATSSVAAVETASVPQPMADVYPVARVVMGGKNVKIRLIGLDTPETVDPRKPVQCFGKEASAKAKELLTVKSVRVEKDPSQGEFDKYGRLLAYIYLPDGTLFNKYMISEGYGHEYTYNLPYKYQKEFKAAQAQARTGKKGLWADGACGGNTTRTSTGQLKTI